jgi:hypothetical protein
MKTAMQELIDEMNEMLIDGNGSIYVLREQARRLLKNEKEQIKDAYKQGTCHHGDGYTATEYYEETFNTNEK